MSLLIRIGPDALLSYLTFGDTYPQYKSLEHEIITDLANIIKGKNIKILKEEVSRLLDRFKLLFSKVLEFIKGVLEIYSLYNKVVY